MSAQEKKTTLDEALRLHREKIVEHRPKWARGPWDQEPDRVEFEHAGLPCIMSRQVSHGHWCGYVGIKPDHPAFGEIPDMNFDAEGNELPVKISDRIRVHGGITYAEHCDHVVCHVPKPGEAEDLWWFGFDCAQPEDASPAAFADKEYPPFPEQTYRTASYVEQECRSLAEQLSRMGR